VPAIAALPQSLAKATESQSGVWLLPQKWFVKRWSSCRYLACSGCPKSALPKSAKHFEILVSGQDANLRPIP